MITKTLIQWAVSVPIHTFFDSRKKNLKRRDHCSPTVFTASDVRIELSSRMHISMKSAQLWSAVVATPCIYLLPSNDICYHSLIFGPKTSTSMSDSSAELPVLLVGTLFRFCITTTFFHAKSVTMICLLVGVIAIGWRRPLNLNCVRFTI